MKTIILCGGTGTRLKEETEFKPKPMVLIGGKPILWHIMKMYSMYGYSEFVLAMGYKANYIVDYFKENPSEFKIDLVDTGLETQPGERILMCKEYVGDRFMVTYGDGVSDLDIGALVKFHCEQGTMGTITGVHPKSKFGRVMVGKNNRVKKFTEKPVLRDWANGGFMVFDNEVFDYIEKGETEHAMLKRLTALDDLSLYKHDGFWFCMDTYKEVTELNEMWADNPKWRTW